MVVSSRWVTLSLWLLSQSLENSSVDVIVVSSTSSSVVVVVVVVVVPVVCCRSLFAFYTSG